ncbi:MAG: YCF48-related protein [Thermoleophilaceae bacterium]
MALAAVGAAPAGAAPVTASHSGWFWGTPLPQGNTLHALDFIGSRGYAVGNFGTILRTDDNGANWSGLQTGVTVNLDRVQMIAPDSFVASGACSVRRSDDGGRSFRRLPWTASDRRCSSPPADFAFPTGQTGYLLLRDGNVLRTDDGGQTWGRRTAVPGSRAARGGAAMGTLAFTDTETGYVTTNTGFVYKTTDGGSTWTPVVADWVTSLTGMSFPDAQRGFVVGQAGAILRTDNGGDYWQVVYFDEATDLRSIDCADDSTCIATAADGSQVLRTTDGGDSWTSVTPSTERIADAAFAAATRAAAVGEGGITVISNDAGEHFRRVGGRLVGEYTGLRALDPLFAYAFGKGGALAKTLDGGATWHGVDVATPDDVVDAWFPTTQVGFALDAVGQLLRTDNAGVSWQILNTGTQTAPSGVLALNPRRVVLIGPAGLRVSTNGGGDFRPIRVKKVQTAALVRADHVGDTVFAYGPRAIFASRNGGLAWRSWRLPFTLHKRTVGQKPKQKVIHVYTRSIDDADFVTARSAYLLDDLGRVWRTHDGGRHWRQVPAVGTEVGTDLAFSDTKNGWLSVGEFGDDDSGYVLRTSDGGRTWRPQLIGREKLVFNGLAAPGAASGFALAGPNLLFGTTSKGDRGAPTTVTMNIRGHRAGKAGTLKVNGRLAPAKGGEQVVVSMRDIGKSSWLYETVQVASNGTFTVVADVQRSTQFVAQWAGDDTRAGDGSPVLTVKIKRKKCKPNVPAAKQPNCIKPKAPAKAAASRFVR